MTNNVTLSYLCYIPPDDSIGEYEKITIPTKPVEVYISHTENENLFFGCRNGGEVVSIFCRIKFILISISKTHSVMFFQ